MRPSGFTTIDVAAIVLFIGSCSMLVLTLIEIGFFQSLVESKKTEYSYRGSDYPRTWDIPPLERAQLTMEGTVHFAHNTSQGDREWEASLPSGGGLIYLPDPTSPTAQPYSISMFHQMRCLNIIRKGLIHYRATNRTEKPAPVVHHCVNYLRQMILCRADLQLEHGRHLTRNIAVWDITHSTCKDWSAVYEAAEENNRLYRTSRGI